MARRGSLSARATFAAVFTAVLAFTLLPASATAQTAEGEYILRAGTMIPGLLLTGINSDLTCEIIGQVSRDVYDAQIDVVVVPQGSRVIGTCSNQVALGQDRLVVAWNVLQLPDGRSYALPGLKITDRQGSGGVVGEVSNHWRQVFGNAALLSLLSAGQAAAAPPVVPGQLVLTPQQQAQQTLSTELNQVATEILRRNMNISPTVTVHQGAPFMVFVSQDMVLPAWVWR